MSYIEIKRIPPRTGRRYAYRYRSYRIPGLPYPLRKLIEYIGPVDGKAIKSRRKKANAAATTITTPHKDPRPTHWDHTEEERKVIKAAGGTPLTKYGSDGVLANGKPCEVRSHKKDNRYQIQRKVHRELLKGGGSYLFVHEGKTKQVTAKQVDKLLGSGRWYKDRSYFHKFIKINQIFP